MKKVIRELMRAAGFEDYNKGGYYQIPVDTMLYRMQHFAELIQSSGFEPDGYKKLYGEIRIACCGDFKVICESGLTDVFVKRVYGYTIENIYEQLSKTIENVTAISSGVDKLIFEVLKENMINFCKTDQRELYLDEDFVKISINVHDV